MKPYDYRVWLAASILMVGVVGCAHSQNEMVVPAEAQPATTTAFPPTLQVPLPYGFTRRGVEVTVNSVEFSSGQFQVSLALHETRGQPAEILTSTLMEARTAANQVLPYTGYLLEGKKQSGPEVRLAADGRLAIDLLFQMPPDAAPATPVLIQFRTGKWWKS